MSSNKVGRKNKYTDNQLKSIIKQYKIEHIEEKVTIPKLIIYSNISKATWYRSSEARQYIEDINSTPLLIKFKETKMPSVNDIKKSCGDDVGKYINAVSQLMDIISEQGNEIIRLKKCISESETKSIMQLKEEIIEKDKIINRLQNKINLITVKDDKLINMQDNIEKMNIDTFNKQFGELFEDD